MLSRSECSDPLGAPRHWYVNYSGGKLKRIQWLVHLGYWRHCADVHISPHGGYCALTHLAHYDDIPHPVAERYAVNSAPVGSRDLPWKKIERDGRDRTLPLDVFLEYLDIRLIDFDGASLMGMGRTRSSELDRSAP